jgi:hypothetical protein
MCAFSQGSVDHDWASGTHGIPVPSRLHTGT